MPPKTPALKFRPRYVARPVLGETEPHAMSHREPHRATEEMSSLPEDDINNLNLVQLERLRRRAEEETDTITSTEVENSNNVIISQRHQEMYDVNTSHSNDTDAMGKHGAKRGNVGHSGTSTISFNNAIEKTSLSAHAQLQRAVERFVNIDAFPECAPRLPCNTMSSFLCNSAGNTLPNSHGERTYYPIPLTDVNSCSKLVDFNNSLGGNNASESRIDDIDTKFDANGANSNYSENNNNNNKSNNNNETNHVNKNSETRLIKNEFTEELRVNAANSDNVAAEQIVVDGTQFLRAHVDETRNMYNANQKFVQKVIELQTSNDAFDIHTSDMHDGTLAWMQMPQFGKADAPFQLEQLTPGKVGELKVMRSGRMILEIGGVEYEVCVESEVDQSSSANNIDCKFPNNMKSNNGVHAVAVATSTKSSVSMERYNEFDDDEERRHQTNLHHREHGASGNVCVELGVLQQKLICTPVLDRLESPLSK